MCYTRCKNIAKAKVFARKDNPTPEILAQRARMKVLVQLSRSLLPVIQKGFVGIGKGSTSNAFVAENMGAIEVTVTYSEENQKFLFEQAEQEEEDGFALSDDLVYGVLYETERERARLVALRPRGESGSTTYALPDEWDNTKVKVYCFAMQKNGKRASDSLLIS